MKLTPEQEAAEKAVAEQKAASIAAQKSDEAKRAAAYKSLQADLDAKKEPKGFHEYLNPSASPEQDKTAEIEHLQEEFHKLQIAASQLEGH